MGKIICIGCGKNLANPPIYGVDKTYCNFCEGEVLE